MATRTCDERCWNAQSDDCTCECDGANHGKNVKTLCQTVLGCMKPIEEGEEDAE